MPCSESVARRLPPCSTLTLSLPLMLIFTLPLGDRYFLATSNRMTKRSIITKNTPILVRIRLKSIE